MKKALSTYLERNILFPRYFEDSIHQETQMVVVIPCHNESNIISCLEGLDNCIDPSCKVAVIVSINAGVNDNVDIINQNIKTFQDVTRFLPSSPWLSIYPIMNNDLPPKKAGVGLGRKIGMDEAVQHFLSVGRDDGIIVCFDADSQCDDNYLVEIKRCFENGKYSSCSIRYEHPIEGAEYVEKIYNAIIQYELHLLYFIDMQKKAHLPFAYHTVGSSMACTCEAYCSVGGMNQRKAGEDFYFLHKLIKFGWHTNLYSTCVIPSPRISDRVPFGTGKAVGELIEGESTFYTYHPQSFYDFERLIENLSSWYENNQLPDGMPIPIVRFLESLDYVNHVKTVFQNTTDYQSWKKRLFHWFDAFTFMKYLHFCRDNYYDNIPVSEAVKVAYGWEGSPKELLVQLREREYGS